MHSSEGMTEGAEPGSAFIDRSSLLSTRAGGRVLCSPPKGSLQQLPHAAQPTGWKEKEAEQILANGAAFPSSPGQTFPPIPDHAPSRLWRCHEESFSVSFPSRSLWPWLYPLPSRPPGSFPCLKGGKTGKYTERSKFLSV